MAAAPDGDARKLGAGSIALFAVSALLVGAIGSAQLWKAQMGAYPVPFGRIVGVIWIAELLAYFTVMLAQLGGKVSGAPVFAGVVAGMVLRALEAALAAILGSPENSKSFGDAFGHYYAGYYLGAVLQIVVTALFLWLIRTAFEPPEVVLVAPKSDVPDMDPERLRGFHEVTERRRELIGQLMNAEDMQPESEEAPQAPAEQVVLTPPQAQEESAGTPEAPAAEEPVEEPAATVEAEPTAPVAETPTPEPAPETVTPPAAPPLPPVISTPIITPAEPPLTSEQSVILALREDDDERPVRSAVETFRPEPARPAPPSEPPVQVTEQETATSASVPRPAPEALAAVAETLNAATVEIGAGTAVMRPTREGRVVALAAEGLYILDAVLSSADHFCRGASCLCREARIGDPRKILLRYPGGYAGAAMLGDEQGGLLTLLGLPRGANLGVANQALNKLETLQLSGPLPAWPQGPEPEFPPAYRDADLEGRIGPLLEWVPEAAGLASTSSSAGGRQIVTLSRDAAASASIAGAVAHAWGTAEALCMALSRPRCDLVIWSATGGTVACGAATVAGQHLLVALIQSGPEAAGPANVRLGQILNSLGRVAGESSMSGE
ncbi:hypothetical protein LLH03_06505 [bacterium]|nr:hypothetical protein [bacterium]